MEMPPKYALAEVERRWLVDLCQLPALESLPFRIIEDRYLDGGSLRLRRVTDPSEETDAVYKLCKKYGKTGVSEFIANLYLTPEEYEALASLPGADLVKRRYQLEGGSLDLLLLPEGIPAIFEAEFRNVAEADAYLPPSFTTQEVTDTPGFSCAVLARSKQLS